MLSKEKIQSLSKYANDLKNRLAETVIPTKHAHRVESYKRFLKNELESVTAQLERAKMEAPSGSRG